MCLITGTVDSVRQVHNFIMDRIREKPDPNPKPVDGDLKVNFERHKQVGDTVSIIHLPFLSLVVIV